MKKNKKCGKKNSNGKTKHGNTATKKTRKNKEGLNIIIILQY